MIIGVVVGFIIICWFALSLKLNIGRGRRLILNEYAKLIIESAIDYLLAAKGKI